MKSVKKLTEKAKGSVYLIVKKNNNSAIKCYTKAGFVFGREDNGYDRMVYKKKQTRKNK
jgi:ribosomal protein S18 acetylase RimI-like enzyme